MTIQILYISIINMFLGMAKYLDTSYSYPDEFMNVENMKSNYLHASKKHFFWSLLFYYFKSTFLF